MVVVVGGRPSTPIWVVLVITAIVLIVVGVVLFLLLGGGQTGGLVVVAIPGFPVESIITGVAFGLLLLVLRRKSIRED